MEARHKGAAGSAVRWALAAAVVMITLLYVPAPYVVLQPGLVESAAPHVRSSAEPDNAGAAGEWMITTVYMNRRINFWTAAQSMWRSDREAYSKSKFLRGGSIREYSARMVVLMEDSQSQAIEAAYKQLGIGYELLPDSLVVAGTAGKRSGFEPGDRITGVNGEPAASGEALLELLRQGYGSGAAELAVDVERNGAAAEIAVRAPEKAANAASGTAAQLLPTLLGGVELIERRKIRTFDPAHAVSIEAGDVGGPSAGLVFALQIVDRLTPGDMAQGRRIAATGTIAPSGKVGEIGGVGLKVIAAHRAKADLLIVPEGNVKEAEAKAEDIGAGFDIIGVSTLDEAIRAVR
ncbi:S16 family serine protease [uncultured Paenibacillus sp.]|uniref:S16 family serine protease n=1 Tax=uncultured Paenibacillus sp. TaxID=227322 RepID=UPI0028D2FC1C|nr:S16 family serine protease [uncultured Paenibacillus sp.]